jgi:hypothetical protein
MTRAGFILIAIALGIAALGTVQLYLVLWLSGDPTINPVGNGILMWLSWAIASVLGMIGAAMALFGLARGNRISGRSS